jgi:hypothetical protein
MSKKKKEMKQMSKIGKESLMYILLAAITVMAPLISYSGVSLIYPNSQITSGVNTSPPITWAQGTDYSSAQQAGFVTGASLVTSDSAAGFTLTVNGLSGGNLTVDNMVTVTAISRVTSFKVKIGSALTGSLSPAATVLKLRFWTGSTAPTADNSAGVAAVLDLKSALNTETTATITGSATYKVQIVVVYATSTTGSSSVSIAPSSIIIA